VTPSGRDRAALRDLDDVLTRAANIVARGRGAFDADDAIRLACEALSARVGEIARERLSAQYRESRSDIPWSDIIRMRDLLLHQYHRTDYNIVWDTVAQRMPLLRKQLADDLQGARAASTGCGDVEADFAKKAQDALRSTRRQVVATSRPPRWTPDTSRCGSTETISGHPCRNPVPSPGRRCAQHRPR
jgi:uncharacterized protein with HEPN domain